MGELPSLIIGRDVQPLPDALALSSPSLSSLSSLSPSNSQTPSSPNPPSLKYYCTSKWVKESTGRQEPHRGHSSRFLCPEPCQCSIALLQYTTQPCSIHTRQWVLLHSVCDAVSRGAAGGVTLLSSDVYTPGALGILGS